MRLRRNEPPWRPWKEALVSGRVNGRNLGARTRMRTDAGHAATAVRVHAHEYSWKHCAARIAYGNTLRETSLIQVVPNGHFTTHDPSEERSTLMRVRDPGSCSRQRECFDRWTASRMREKDRYWPRVCRALVTRAIIG